MKCKFLTVWVIFFLLFAIELNGAEPTDSTTNLRHQINQVIKQHFEGTWFFSYQFKKENNQELNQFAIKRSYLTLKHRFNERFNVRFTQDLTIDEEGSDAGNVEMRLKYLFLNINLDDFAFVTRPCMEVGLVHRPWHSFEEDINTYRVQGSMFLDRSGLFSSADYGMTFSGLLGGLINETYRKNVNTSHPGRYGSYSLGIYNGGGYHQTEKNHNKTLEGRLTIRPLPSVIPGLQFTYFGVYGKGNIPTAPDFVIHNVFTSYEHEKFALTAQLYRGEGNAFGTYVDEQGDALKNDGYSVFGEYKFPEYKWRAFVRYDFFQVSSGLFDEERFIWGVGYDIFDKSRLVFNMEYSGLNSTSSNQDFFYEVALDLRF